MKEELRLGIIGTSKALAKHGDHGYAAPVPLQDTGKDPSISGGDNIGTNPMPERLGLAAIRREQRRVAALLDASRQFGLVIPGRYDSIPLKDLYKSNYYLQVQAGFRQMYMAGTQQTALSLPEMSHIMRTRHGNHANNVCMASDSSRSSIGSTQEGWRHLRESLDDRERIAKRNQFRSKDTGGAMGKRFLETPDRGAASWSPDVATRHQWTQKRIRSDIEAEGAVGRAMLERSRAAPDDVNMSRVTSTANHAGNVDFRLPRLIKPGRPRPRGGHGSLNGSQAEDPDHVGNGSYLRNSVAGKPLLRYNHGSTGQGMDLSKKGSPADPRRRDTDEDAEWRSTFSDSPEEWEDTYRPFYPKTPSATPASLDSASGLEPKGHPGVGLNEDYSDDPDLVTTRGEVAIDTVYSADVLGQEIDHTGSQDRIHETKYGSTAEENVPTHDTLDINRLRARTLTNDRETSLVDPYRDAYARALAVARSRQLPGDPAGLGTRTSRAFSFSYFAHQHRPSCKCQTCLERALRDWPLMKRPANKKRKTAQGI